MIIVLTEAKTGLQFTIGAALILCSRTVVEDKPRRRDDRVLSNTPAREEEAKSLTHVITGIQAQGQLQSFAVIESPLEIGRRINAALGCAVSPCLLGYPLG